MKIEGNRCDKCKAELTFEVPQNPTLAKLMRARASREAKRHKSTCGGKIVKIAN